MVGVVRSTPPTTQPQKKLCWMGGCPLSLVQTLGMELGEPAKEMSPQAHSVLVGEPGTQLSVEQVKNGLERKKGGERKEKKAELCQFLHLKLQCQTPTGPLHFPVVDHRYPTQQFRFHVWVERQEGPRSIRAVTSLGLLSEQKSEWIVMEGVCVAL